LSVALLLGHLGHEDAARRVEDAVAADLFDRSTKGARSTAAIGDELAARVAG
jgi:3-isopropylmalate dehydrogenase